MIRNTNAIRYSEGIPKNSSEELTWEEALQIRINGKPYTVTMRTPGQDSSLAAGLLFTERIIRIPHDILSIREVQAAQGDHTVSVDVEIKSEVLINQNIFNRSIASSASCGVCGKTDICDLASPDHFNATTKKLQVGLIPEMVATMREQQITFERTGGSHAASLFTAEGHLLSVHEDIGRHNAVDKVIGELFLKRSIDQADIMLISSRVSYEIVAKCAQAKIPFLIAVSAPSSLAVEYCHKSGITLIAFCRDHRFTVYTHPKNIEQEYGT